RQAVLERHRLLRIDCGRVGDHLVVDAENSRQVLLAGIAQLHRASPPRFGRHDGEKSEPRKSRAERERMLIVFGGLPATGKSTLARALAQERQAVYLRIDTIEQALRSAELMGEDVGPAGYVIACALAEANLRLGLTVVADAVNPLALTRNAWRRVA